MTHAVFLFLVGQTVEFFRERAQRFGEQADFVGLHRQFIGLGAEECADTADDVADIPALERRIGFLASVSYLLFR